MLRLGGCWLLAFPWFPRPKDPQGESLSIFEGFHASLNLQHRIANRRETVAAVGGGEEFGLHDSGAICDGHELHGFAGDLVVGALFDHQTAGDDGLPSVLTQAVDRAVGVPRHFGPEFERVTAHGKAEQLGFGA